MSFFASPCNPIRRDSNLNSTFYSNLMFSIIVFESLVVMASIIYSTIKNYKCEIMQSEKKGQNYQQMHVVESLKNEQKNEMLPTSHSIFGGFKSGKSLNEKKIMHIGSNCQDSQEFESIDLEKKITKKGSKKKRIVRMRRQPENENKISQCPKLWKDPFNERQDNYQQVVSRPWKNLQKEYFINIGQLRLSKDKASTYLNLVLGHFFIGGALAMQISPQIVSVSFSGVHCVLFIVLLVVNIFITEVQGKYLKHKTEQKPQEDEKKQETISIDFRVHQQSQNEIKIEEKIENIPALKINQKVNYVVMGLIMQINLSLLSLCVIRMKQSYYDVVLSKCA